MKPRITDDFTAAGSDSCQGAEHGDGPLRFPSGSAPSLQEAERLPPPFDRTWTTQRTRAPAVIPAGIASVAARQRDRERYHILGEHGRGGLGRVSRAHDVELGRDVAIKELISRSHVSEIRFLREALITARLEHPGIIPVHEAGRWPDGTPFYAMKLVAGRPLRDLIVERKTVAQRVGLLHHVIAVADTIAYAHDRNVIHRDLKPANVIVGDFGETVVIDWGLAKDLGAGEEPVAEDRSVRVADDDGLTSAGTVLGTPAYMAPEQARGEPVDQRADVFAIGAMLWELCTLEKLPPAYGGHRRRILRQAGIDADLIAIIEKAVDPDPERRYRDAGRLAADLKAFKAGTRIAARDYSFAAVAGHWARRHRGLAYSLAALAVLAASVGLLYVRNIAAERDRADRARERSEAAKDALVLEHAELLLKSDPTSALAAITDYHGPELVRARQIAAEARGRGVAHSAADVHSDAIRMLVGTRDGTIISASGDRRLVATRDGNTTVLATDVALPIVLKYSTARGILVYASLAGTVVLEPQSQRRALLSPSPASSIAMAPDGSEFVVLDAAHDATVWSTEWPARPKRKQHIADAGMLSYIDTSQILVVSKDRFRVLSWEDSFVASLDAGFEALSASPSRLVIAAAHGVVATYSLPDLKPAGSIVACQDRVRDVSLIAGRSLIAFGCHDSSAGVIDDEGGTPSVRERFATQGPVFQVVASEDGRWFVALSDSSTAYLHDVDHRLTRHYDGPARLVYAAAPTSAYPELITGDVNGSIRSWDPPDGAARAAMRTGQSTLRIAVSPDSRLVAAGVSDGTLSVIGAGATHAETKREHTALISNLDFLPDGRLVTTGHDGRALLWNADTLTVLQRIENLPSTAGIDHVARRNQVVLAGSDGRLRSWSLDRGTVDVVFSSRLPLTAVQTLPSDGSAIVVDAGGAVWLVRGAGDARLLREANGDLVRVLRVSDDGRFVAIGTSSGQVALLDASSWKVLDSIAMAGAVRQIAFSGPGDLLAIVSEKREARLVALNTSRRTLWDDRSMDARTVTISPDGRVVALICGDGSTWMYSVQNESWTYVRDHYAFTARGHFSPDSARFVSTDNEGIVTIRSVDRTLGIDRRP